jgi:hypothetical protein
MREPHHDGPMTEEPSPIERITMKNRHGTLLCAASVTDFSALIYPSPSRERRSSAAELMQ